MYRGFARPECHITIFLNGGAIRYSTYAREISVKVNDITVLANFICSHDFVLDGIDNLPVEEKLDYRAQFVENHSLVRYNCHAYTFLNSRSLWFDGPTIENILLHLCTPFPRGEQTEGDIFLIKRGNVYEHSGVFQSADIIKDKFGPLHFREGIPFNQVLTEFPYDVSLFRYPYRPTPIDLH